MSLSLSLFHTYHSFSMIFLARKKTFTVTAKSRSRHERNNLDHGHESHSENSFCAGAAGS